jgi:hypothetical protein
LQAVLRQRFQAQQTGTSSAGGNSPPHPASRGESSPSNPHQSLVPNVPATGPLCPHETATFHTYPPRILRVEAKFKCRQRDYNHLRLFILNFENQKLKLLIILSDAYAYAFDLSKIARLLNFVANNMRTADAGGLLLLAT